VLYQLVVVFNSLETPSVRCIRSLTLRWTLIHRILQVEYSSVAMSESPTSDAVVPDFAAKWIASVLRPGMGLDTTQLYERLQSHGGDLRFLLGMYCSCIIILSL
jgi:hypothetical protein